MGESLQCFCAILLALVCPAMSSGGWDAASPFLKPVCCIQVRDCLAAAAEGREWHSPKPPAARSQLLQVGEGAVQEVGYHLVYRS